MHDGTDHDFVHVAVRRIEQAAALRSRQHGDRTGGSGCAKIRAFQRIDGNVDFGHLHAIGKFRADLLSDVEHGRFISLAFADHDGAAHRNRVHGLAHGLGRYLVTQLALALAHGAGRVDGRYFDDPQESRCQVALNVFPEAAGFSFRTGLRSHECFLRVSVDAPG